MFKPWCNPFHKDIDREVLNWSTISTSLRLVKEQRVVEVVRVCVMHRGAPAKRHSDVDGGLTR